MTRETTDRVFRFGAFEVNEATGELRKQGIRIKLHSQPFQILVSCSQRPSELVTREESVSGFGAKTRSWTSTTA